MVWGRKAVMKCNISAHGLSRAVSGPGMCKPKVNVTHSFKVQCSIIIHYQNCHQSSINWCSLPGQRIFSPYRSVWVLLAYSPDSSGCCKHWGGSMFWEDTEECSRIWSPNRLTLRSERMTTNGWFTVCNTARDSPERKKLKPLIQIPDKEITVEAQNHYRDISSWYREQTTN